MSAVKEALRPDDYAPVALIGQHEEWEPIVNYEYEVSTQGRVRRNGRLLSPRHHTNGYLRVSLASDGRTKDAYIHRLVCLAFHGRPASPHHHAHHIDGDRTNNTANNLQWLSPEQNRALRNIARGSRSGLSRLTEARVQEIRRVNSARMDRSFAEQFGVARETVRDARLGKLWRHVS